MKYKSRIAALSIVSESEIAKVHPNYEASWEQDKPTYFERILQEFGLDTSMHYERQDGLQHRNMFNEVVTCSRWVGQARQDREWLVSGLASKESLDKARNSSLLDDLYRARMLTEDAQAALEARDAYQKQED